jgi:glucose/arabinose dehydrogenase
MKIFHYTIIVALSIVAIACSTNDHQSGANVENQQNDSIDNSIYTSEDGLKLNTLIMPSGYKIAVFARVENARSMTIGDNGTIFVGTNGDDKVYALQDLDGDFRADGRIVVSQGLRNPNGVAFKDGALYIAEISKLWKLPNIENTLSAPKSELIYDDYPEDGHHGWKYIAFGPDGKLYVPVGAPCNVCESKNEIYASITRMNADGSQREIIAKGIRNTVGFTWHPTTQEMYFTDNGRDMLGDDIPPCELNRMTEIGQNYGFPYCHGGTIQDPEFGDKFDCNEFTAPIQKLGAHVAPLGIKFYTGNLFPDLDQNTAIIAEHGSWNRSKKVGYRLSNVQLENGKGISYEPFIYGWLNETDQTSWGRPVDVLILKDGSMLVSDDQSGTIYRISYSN